MKHRRAKHHRRMRKCDCVRCTVAYFADWQRAIQRMLDGDKFITITPEMDAHPESVDHLGETIAAYRAVA